MLRKWTAAMAIALIATTTLAACDDHHPGRNRPPPGKPGNGGPGNGGPGQGGPGQGGPGQGGPGGSQGGWNDSNNPNRPR